VCRDRSAICYRERDSNMATATRKTRNATSRKKTVAIDSALGAEKNGLFEELAAEAKVYIDLVRRLKSMPEKDSRREDLEGELYGSIAHLSTHATLLLEEIDKATDKL